jgi:transposase
MSQLNATAKHHILLEYSPCTATHSFSALATRHNIAGGERTVRRWHKQWDGTVESLQHKKGAGRPHIMEEEDVEKYVATPIRRANRAHKRVNYRKVLDDITNKTDLQPSYRTVRRYGKDELKGKKTRGVKRTAEESK